MTDKQIKELEEKARPLLEWMAENCNPHTYAIVDYSKIELVEGILLINQIGTPTKLNQ